MNRSDDLGRVEVRGAEVACWERNALSPKEIFDVRVEGWLAGQVLLDDAHLAGAPATGETPRRRANA